MPPKYKIFVINLDRAPDRLSFMEKQFAGLSLSFERLQACDGKTLTQDQIKNYYDAALNRRNFVRPLQPGQIGCYISHLTAWQKILDDQLDFAVILEDDVTILNNIEEVLETLARHVEGWSYIRIQKGDRPRRILSRSSLGNFELLEEFKGLAEMFGYALTKTTAQTLIEKRRHFGRPVDIDLQYTWETGIMPLDMRPWCIESSEHSRNSNIQACQPQKTKAHFPFVRQIRGIQYTLGRIADILVNRGIIRGIKMQTKCFLSKPEIP